MRWKGRKPAVTLRGKATFRTGGFAPLNAALWHGNNMDQMDNSNQRNVVLILPKPSVQKIIDYLCLVQDEGPVSAGWKSDDLMSSIGVLEEAIEEGYVYRTG